MEELLRAVASHVALGVETVAVLLVAFGSVHALVAIIGAAIRPRVATLER